MLKLYYILDILIIIIFFKVYYKNLIYISIKNYIFSLKNT